MFRSSEYVPEFWGGDIICVTRKSKVYDDTMHDIFFESNELELVY